jgi:hypothetical protein
MRCRPALSTARGRCICVALGDVACRRIRHGAPNTTQSPATAGPQFEGHVRRRGFHREGEAPTGLEHAANAGKHLVECTHVDEDVGRHHDGMTLGRALQVAGQVALQQVAVQA